MHIYEDEELEESSTCRKFRQVRKEGKRTVKQGKKLFAYIKMQEELDEEGTYAKFAYMGHKLDIERHNQQYPPITVNLCHRNHDRFLIIDDVVYLFGASLKDAGKKLFAYIKMQETPAAELLNNIR